MHIGNNLEYYTFQYTKAISCYAFLDFSQTYNGKGEYITNLSKHEKTKYYTRKQETADSAK